MGGDDDPRSCLGSVQVFGSVALGQVLLEGYGLPAEGGDRLFQLGDDIRLVREPATRLPPDLIGSVVVDEGGMPRGEAAEA